MAALPSSLEPDSDLQVGFEEQVQLRTVYARVGDEEVVGVSLDDRAVEAVGDAEGLELGVVEVHLQVTLIRHAVEERQQVDPLLLGRREHLIDYGAGEEREEGLSGGGRGRRSRHG